LLQTAVEGSVFAGKKRSPSGQNRKKELHDNFSIMRKNSMVIVSRILQAPDWNQMAVNHRK
jgi:hypothetical protein